jgi:hypothetical protein
VILSPKNSTEKSHIAHLFFTISWTRNTVNSKEEGCPKYAEP